MIKRPDKAILACVIFWSLGFAVADPGPFDECLRCHGGPEAGPPGSPESVPLFPDTWQAAWTMHEYSLEFSPPMDRIPGSAESMRGKTYYSKKLKSFTEIYEERCINIFPDGRDFPCQFLSKGSVTWLIRFQKGNLAKAVSCEVWPLPGFYGPQPDVLRHFPERSNLRFRGEAATRWYLDTGLPGPFGFLTGSGPGFRPVSFWFPVIDSWAQQDFSHFSSEEVPEDVFLPPALCPTADAS